LVAFLEGAETPFILEKVGFFVDDPPNNVTPLPLYRIVGECYLHGFMDGVVFNSPKSSEYTREIA
jgi:hypothetical protein